MKIVFLAYNHKDKVIAQLIYHCLIKEKWSDIYVFMDEFSIAPGQDIHDGCINKAKSADLAIVVLSEYTQQSAYVSQEIGILLSREIPKIYVSLHEDWVIPPGYEKTIKSFPLHKWQNPFDGFNELIQLIKEYLKPKEIGVIELINEAVRLSNQGKFEEALEYCEKAIRNDPDYDNAYTNKMGILRKLGRYSEALEFADVALAKFPKHIGIMNNKGFLLYSLKKYEEAINIFGTVLDKDSNNLYALYYKGRNLECCGKKHKALAYYKQLYELSPETKMGQRAQKRIILLE
ncbi:tetratricopeptide repeat protein [candidate division WOR-3 bacterium]|nr:tetratricopeptide repeat protein [candidate division WOR-3 bacterium]